MTRLGVFATSIQIPGPAYPGSYLFFYQSFYMSFYLGTYLGASLLQYPDSEIFKKIDPIMYNDILWRNSVALYPMRQQPEAKPSTLQRAFFFYYRGTHTSFNPLLF